MESQTILPHEDIIQFVEEKCEVDYPIGDSCLFILFVKKERVSNYNSSILHFKQIFDYDLTVKDKFKLSKFQEACGLTEPIVIAVMLSYLATKNRDCLSNILERYSIDLNTLGWMMYHSVKSVNLMKSVKFIHKRNEERFCVICLARTEVVVMGNYYITISPKYMSGDRAGQTSNVSTGNAHFVVWPILHDKLIDLEHVERAIKSFWPNDFQIFKHGSPQYGHDHVHVIGGSFYDIRAKELMIKSQKSVNNKSNLVKDDFFHPIKVYFKECTNVGKSYVIIALIIQKVRISLSIKDIDIALFYKASYPVLFDSIAENLECLTSSEISYSQHIYNDHVNNDCTTWSLSDEYKESIGINTNYFRQYQR